MLVGASFMGALFLRRGLRNIPLPCGGVRGGSSVHVFVQEFFSLAHVRIYRYVYLERGVFGLYLCVVKRKTGRAEQRLTL